jgi:hypothetical protein
VTVPLAPAGATRGAATETWGGADHAGLLPHLRSRLWSSEAMLVIGFACLCFGTMWAYDVVNSFTLVSLALVLAALPLCALALVAPRRPAGGALWAAAAAASAVGMGLHWTSWSRAAAVAALAAAAALLARHRVAWLLVLVALGLQAWILAGAWIWGVSDIDVFYYVQSAAGALLHGRDPYGPSFPGFVQGVGTVPVHLPYGPSVAAVAVPGAAAGDVRVSGLAFTTGALLGPALWIGRAAAHRAERVRLAALAVALGTTTVVVVHAWVEVYTMGLFVAWLLLRRRLRPLAVAALALCLLTKPTVAPALVSIFLWSRTARAELLCAAGLAALGAVPFALWTGWHNFYEDVVGVHLHLFPVRTDALTVDALLHAIGRPYLRTSMVAVIVGLTVLLLVLRRPRGAGDVLSGGTLLTVVVLVCAKEAFMNYYWAVAVLALLAIAARDMQLDPEGPQLWAPLAWLQRRLLAGAGRPASGSKAPPGMASSGTTATRQTKEPRVRTSAVPNTVAGDQGVQRSRTDVGPAFNGSVAAKA